MTERASADWRWPLWATAAGAVGAIGHLFTIQTPSDEAREVGVAAAMAWLALRERRLPLWIGLVSAIFAVAPVGILVATGLPGFPGVVDPFWLVIVGIGLALSLRTSESSAAAGRPILMPAG